MSFAAPIYLLALLPWTGIVIVLLIGRHQEQGVPFLQLWRGYEKPPRNVRANFTLPPVATMCALAAIGFAILGASRPRLTWITAPNGPKITLILDRGLTMQASQNGQPRWKQLIQTANRPLLEQFGDGPVDLWLIPEGRMIHADRLDWTTAMDSGDPPAVDSRQALNELVARVLSSGGDPMIVLSDQSIGLDARVIQFAPDSQANNVGIVDASIRETPKAQAMIRVRNDSDLKTAALNLSGKSRIIDLPKRGELENYFIDLDQLTSPATIDLNVSDDLPLDNHAMLVRSGSWPVMEIRGEVPPQVQRMIETYSRLRLPGDTSRRVVISTEATSGPAVIVPNLNQQISSNAIQVQHHPVTANIDWPTVARESLGYTDPPPGEWMSVVSAENKPLVSVRDTPARQVWIGFTSETFPRSSDFVIFWSNVLDWIGQANPGFRFEGISSVKMPTPPKNDWQEKLAFLPVTTRAGIDLTSGALIVAMGLLLTASMVWAKKP